MRVEFPIQFKYYTLDRGGVRGESEDAVAYQGYVVSDKLGNYVAGSRNLAAMIAFCAGRDCVAEEAQQFLDRKLENFKHLDGVDIDARPDTPAGLMVPPHMMVSGGGSRGGSGVH